MRPKLRVFEVQKKDKLGRRVPNSKFLLLANSHCDAHVKYCALMDWEGTTETIEYIHKKKVK